MNNTNLKNTLETCTTTLILIKGFNISPTTAKALTIECILEGGNMLYRTVEKVLVEYCQTLKQNITIIEII